LGLPEVLLGIHPGFGGTVRTVRLIGVRPALDLMLQGKPYRGARALKVGLLDRLVPAADLKASAKRLLLEAPPRKSAPSRRSMKSSSGGGRSCCAREKLSKHSG